MVVVGSDVQRAKDGAILKRTLVAASYDPKTRTWRELAPAGAPSDLGYSSVWTGREMLVWGQGSHLAYEPATDRWRTFPSSKLLSIHDAHGLVAWTGREMIGWGGGCCGDAFSDGVAYNPTTNAWRALPRSPLAGSQGPVGAWDGRELLVFVGNTDPDGRRWPARLARAAAYEPSTNTWRRLAPAPLEITGALPVWDGHELLVAGAGGGRALLAFDPKTNRWRRLAPMPGARAGGSAVWSARHLVVWGGRTGSSLPRTALVYDQRTNRWTTDAAAPVAGRQNASAVSTGRALIVFGGVRAARPSGNRYFTDGASFTP